jgi:hypothetical protein
LLRGGATGVVTFADAVDEGAIGFEAVEIPAPPATERLPESELGWGLCVSLCR